MLLNADPSWNAIRKLGPSLDFLVPKSALVSVLPFSLFRLYIYTHELHTARSGLCCANGSTFDWLLVQLNNRFAQRRMPPALPAIGRRYPGELPGQPVDGCSGDKRDHVREQGGTDRPDWFWRVATGGAGLRMGGDGGLWYRPLPTNLQAGRIASACHLVLVIRHGVGRHSSTLLPSG